MMFAYMRRLRRMLAAALVLVAMSGAALAIADERNTAAGAKRPLAHADFPRWNAIETPQLSNDGRWVAYALQAAQRVDGSRSAREIVLRATDATAEHRFPAGRVAGFGARAQVMFTTDSRFLLFTAIDDAAPSGSQSTGQSVQDSSLAIVRLADGHVTKVPGATAFQLSPAGDWVSYVRQAPTDAGDAQTKEADRPRTLVLRELATAREVVLPEVTELVFDAAGTRVAYAVTSAYPDRSGVFVRRLRDGAVMAVQSGRGSYRGLVADGRTGRLAFLSDRNDPGHATPRYSIWLGGFDSAPAEPAVRATTLPEGMVVSAKDALRFTPRGNALTFMIRPEKERVTPATTESGAKFELWHWQASTFLPNGHARQTPFPWSASARHFAEDTYLSVYHIDRRQWTRLETPAIREVLLSDDGRRAIGFDRSSHALARIIEGWIFDLHEIDVMSGKARRILERVQPSVIGRAWNMFFQLSPGGEYLVFREGDRWWSYCFDSGEFVNFTERNSDLLAPGVGHASKWRGTAGWTSEDREILLYDAFDVWAYDPNDKHAPRRLTDGRERGRIYRALHDTTSGSMGISREEASRSRQSPHSGWQVDMSRPLLLEGQEVATGDVGIWQLDPKPGAVPRPVLQMPGKRVVGRALATDGPQVLVTMESFQDFPDLWAGPDFANLTRISEANPQQHEYLWGSEQLISFQSESGATLRGRLYKPENFDPNWKYPLVVLVYRTHALDKFRRYGAPALLGVAYTGSSLVPSQLTSRGYVVLQPDIAKITGAPMSSAVDAIVPAVRAMIDTGYVDPDRIALTGHSFGGGEVLYTLTQVPDLFRCAVASAGFTNLIASYGSQSFGGTQPAFLERGQLAMGVSPWADPYRYLQNSAILYADRVSTPLLMMHNNQDNAVAYAEGFQFFAALRRLGKPVWLYNYSSEGHVLQKHANIADWHYRMDAFLDHCLMNAPEPVWMTWPGTTSPFTQAAAPSR